MGESATGLLNLNHNLEHLKIKTNSLNKKYLLSNKEKKEIKLTDLQKQILVGVMLGDAHLERVKVSHNARLRFDQTFP